MQAIFHKLPPFSLHGRMSVGNDGSCRDDPSLVQHSVRLDVAKKVSMRIALKSSVRHHKTSQSKNCTNSGKDASKTFSGGENTLELCRPSG
jgi:hypothetical protein